MKTRTTILLTVAITAASMSVLIILLMVIPNLLRSRMSADGSQSVSDSGMRRGSYLQSEHKEVARLGSQTESSQTAYDSESPSLPLNQFEESTGSAPMTEFPGTIGLHVTSTPPGAEILIATAKDGRYKSWKQGKRTLVTPTNGKLQNSPQWWIKVRKEGYQDSDPKAVDTRLSSTIEMHFELKSISVRRHEE